MENTKLLENFIRERKEDLNRSKKTSEEAYQALDEIAGMEAALKSIKENNVICTTENKSRAFIDGFQCVNNLLMW